MAVSARGRLESLGPLPDGSPGAAAPHSARAASPLRPSSAASNVDDRSSPYALRQRAAGKPAKSRPCLGRILGRRGERAYESCELPGKVLADSVGKPSASSSSSSRYAWHGPKPDLPRLEEPTFARDMEASAAQQPGSNGHSAAKVRGKTALDKCFHLEMKRISQLRQQFPGFSDKLVDNLALGRIEPSLEVVPSANAHLGDAGGTEAAPPAPWFAAPCFLAQGPLLSMAVREPIPPGSQTPHSCHAGGHVGSAGHHPSSRRPGKPTALHQQHPAAAKPGAGPGRRALPTPPSTASSSDPRQRRAKVRADKRQLARAGSSAKSGLKQDHVYHHHLVHIPTYLAEEGFLSRTSTREGLKCAQTGQKVVVRDEVEELPCASPDSAGARSEAASRAAGAFDALLAERAREQDFQETATNEGWFARPKEKRPPTLRRTSDMVMSIQRWLRNGISGQNSGPVVDRSPTGPSEGPESGEASRVSSKHETGASEPGNLHALAKRHHAPFFCVQEAWQEFSACSKQPEQGITYEDFLDLLRRRAHLQDGAPIPARLMGHVTSKDLDEHNLLGFETFLEWSINVGWMEEMQVGSSKELEVRRIAREVHMPILDVEKVKTLFDQFDSDGSGQIDEEEFRHIVYKLWRVEDVSDVPIKTLQRIWRQIDQDASGQIDFQEFLVWYSNFKKFGDRLNMI